MLPEGKGRLSYVMGGLGGVIPPCFYKNFHVPDKALVSDDTCRWTQ